MSADVVIVPCGSYEQQEVEAALAAVLEPLDGLDFVKPGMRIAVKVNLVSAMKPEHPQYTLAKRLVKFLNYIQTSDVEDEIPPNSILREFIGGCCFYKNLD